jgi:hypothetical protein
VQAQQTAATSSATAAAVTADSHADSSEVKVFALCIYVSYTHAQLPLPSTQNLQQRIAALEKHVSPLRPLFISCPVFPLQLIPPSFHEHQLLSSQSIAPAPSLHHSAAATNALPPPSLPSSAFVPSSTDSRPASQMSAAPSNTFSNWHMMQALDSRLQEVLALDMRRQHQVDLSP